jgi:DNA topoisomerase IA
MLSSFTDGNVMATVKNRKVNPKKRYRPYPLTTVKFQKIATDKLKMSSAKAM